MASIQDYGAVGDGITDDSISIQNAIDSGQQVFFPYTPNGYKANGLKPYNGRLHLLSDNGNLVGVGGHALDLDGYGQDADIRIEGLGFQGHNIALNASDAYTGTVSLYARRSRVSDVKRGFWLNCDVANADVQDCDFNDVVSPDRSTAAVALGPLAGSEGGSSGYIVKNNRIKTVRSESGAESHGIWAVGGEGQIEGNTIEDISTPLAVGNGGEAIYTKLAGQKVSGNRIIDGCDGQGAIVLKGASPNQSEVSDNWITGGTVGIGTFCPNVDVLDNLIEDVEYIEGAYLGGAGIAARNANHDHVRVERNRVVRARTAHGIHFRAAGAQNTCSANRVELIGHAQSLGESAGILFQMSYDVDQFACLDNEVEIGQLVAGNPNVYAIRWLSIDDKSYAGLQFLRSIIRADDQAGYNIRGLEIATKASNMINGLNVSVNTVFGTPDTIYAAPTGGTITGYIEQGNSWQ